VRIAPNAVLDAPLAARIAVVAPALRLGARRFGTPLHVTDTAGLDAAAARLADAFPDPWLRHFSVKANDVPAIVREVTRNGVGANVVSRGEWAVARRAGLRNNAVTVEGIGKTERDLAAAVRAARDGEPLRWVSIESDDEARALGAMATRAGLGRRTPPLDVLLRLNPDVTPETHAGLAVGVRGSKFGMDETELTAVLERLPPSVRPRGAHVHVGSQLGAVDAWRDAARRAVALVALVGAARPEFDTVDFGGGFPVLPEGAAGPDPARFAREIGPILATVPDDRRPERLAIEPGRFLVARAGWLVARVLHVRDRGGPLVVLDAGMTELIRPALYDALHDVVALTSRGRVVEPGARWTVGETTKTQVHGPICESSDRLGEHALPPLARGDLVAIADTGAYAASLASTYNGRPLARQVLIERDGTLTLAGRRRRIDVC
jgi:diaminopimelate decarboxylase